jgi:hypothetical protein
VNSKDNYYRGADLTREGGVYYVSATSRKDDGQIEGCEFIEDNSTYVGNQAIFGGAIYAEECRENIKIISSTFKSNRALQGGAIMTLSSKIEDTSGIYK